MRICFHQKRYSEKTKEKVVTLYFSEAYMLHKEIFVSKELYLTNRKSIAMNKGHEYGLRLGKP